jgi:hypothetical protein
MLTVAKRCRPQHQPTAETIVRSTGLLPTPKAKLKYIVLEATAGKSTYITNKLTNMGVAPSVSQEQRPAFQREGDS